MFVFNEFVNLSECILIFEEGIIQLCNKLYNVRIIFIGDIAVLVLKKLNLLIDQKWILYFFKKTKSRIENWLHKKDAQWQAQQKTTFYLPLLQLYVFHRFGQYFHAISRAWVVIWSGSSFFEMFLHFRKYRLRKKFKAKFRSIARRII